MGASRHGGLVSAQSARRCIRPRSVAQRRRRGCPRDRFLRGTRRTVGSGTAARCTNDRRARLPGTDRHLRARHRHRTAGLVPALQRTRCRLGPGGAHMQGRTRRRGVDRQRPEGVDLAGHIGRPGHAVGPHRPRRSQAPWHHMDGDRHASGRGRAEAAVRDDRPRDVQRGVPHRCTGAGRCLGGWPQRRVGCGQHHSRQ